ncbi:hypothetical protein SAY87_026980 [Trapa incisa]|uniref:PRC-barrel domain-containing protein n=1 Tax=Trapa incisa TaxID=236973 RepID=A0AAN7GML5_9MYRT|nr:hypothetical protein SAY87_026980 [Trapa incisa]
MSECVSSPPLPLSIARKPRFLSTSSRTFIASPIRYPPSVIGYTSGHSVRRCYIPSFAMEHLKRSSTDGSYGELGFKEDDCRDEGIRYGASLNLDQQDLSGEASNGEGKASETLPLRNAEEGDLVQVDRKRNRELKMKGGRQVMKRSSLIAKQVISMSSALSLGFVSQLWVDTATWIVVVVEVRPNLLSGESERFCLEEICQVGDVVLVENEHILDYELKMLGLETLVGYEVVTPGRRIIGKVRGYTFNINSGAIESLELDSFGISIIPSSLVSTYALLLEDVLEVASDRVVVHEATASRIQRLTRGLWDNQRAVKPVDEFEEYSEFEKPIGSSSKDFPRRKRGSRSRKFHPSVGETEGDWDLPMDYL